jgi:hypothetical protein
MAKVGKFFGNAKMSTKVAGQTHHNLLGFLINTHYSNLRPVFSLSHSSF